MSMNLFRREKKPTSHIIASPPVTYVYYEARNPDTGHKLSCNVPVGLSKDERIAYILDTFALADHIIEQIGDEDE